MSRSAGDARTPLTAEELAELWAAYERAADEGWCIVRSVDDRDPTPRQFRRLLLEVERLSRVLADLRHDLVETANRSPDPLLRDRLLAAAEKAR